MALEDKALALTGLGFLHTCYAALANVSGVVGDAAAAASWTASAASLRDDITTAFLNDSSGVYAGSGWSGTQCGQAMPLFMQLTPPDVAGRALGVLAANVEDHARHLAVGAFGVKWLLMALSEGGRADLAFAIMTQRDYPGFGYMMNGTLNGVSNATTVWESWPTSSDTYSQNHPMFTSGEVRDEQTRL